MNRFKRRIVLPRFLWKGEFGSPHLLMSKHMSLLKEPVCAGWRSPPSPQQPQHPHQMTGNFGKENCFCLEENVGGRGEVSRIPWKSCWVTCNRNALFAPQEVSRVRVRPRWSSQVCFVGVFLGASHGDPCLQAGPALSCFRMGYDN